MKVSLNWVKEFTDVSLPVDKLVEKVGAQLGAVDEVIDLGARYDGALIVKVVKCEKHPDADKLSVCWVDDGNKVEGLERSSEGLVQVVCGAPNVKADMLAVWLPPGAVVPSTVDKDPFTLEAREIRGVKSNGMLASAKELAIGDSHEGLLVVEEEAHPGDSFAEIYNLNDYIIDIENKMFTHRPDLFGMLGIAREIAGISHIPFYSPAIYKDAGTPNSGEPTMELAVTNQAANMVPRFLAQVFKDVSVKPSNGLMQSYLARCGVRPINNIVDITNYFMLLTGQPLHAYDYDKLKSLSGGSAQLGARLSLGGEKLVLLGGKELTLDEGAVVITAGDKLIGLGGVMGGAETEVDESTRNIVLECATFDMNLTRKTAMRYGLFTDAVTRFTKGQSPLQNSHVVAWAASEIIAQSGGTPDGKAYDLVSSEWRPSNLVVEANFISSRLGLKLDAPAMAQLLQNVEFNVSVDGDVLNIAPPYWRTDIEIAEDIIEEIGRLYGWDHLPLELPVKSVQPGRENQGFKLKSQIRHGLSAAGANEVLTYSFVRGALLELVGQDKEQSFHIKNALSPDLQYYRQSLMPSLLSHVHSNVKNGFDNFAIFEMGKGHLKKMVDSHKLPDEMNMLGLVYTESNKSEGGAAYFQARNYLEYIAGQVLNIGLIYEAIDKDIDFTIAKPYETSRSSLVKTAEGQLLGIVGEFKSSVLNGLKLPLKTAGFEIDLDVLAAAKPLPQYTPINKYPQTNQDITLRIPATTKYIELDSLLREALTSAVKEHGYTYSLKPLESFQRPDDKDHQQTSWRVTLSHSERTLTTDEVNRLFDMIAGQASDKFNAERV